jgi:PAS domain S-box-containing protein
VNQANHTGRYFSFLAAIARPFGLFLLLASLSAAQTKESKHVLILQEEDISWPVYRMIDENIRATLRAGLPGGVLIFSEHLDSGHFPDPKIQTEQVAWIRKKYVNSSLDLVLAVGDVPTDLFPGVPLVFVSADPRRKPPELATSTPHHASVWVGLEAQKTLELAQRLQPTARRIIVIGNGSPPEDTILTRLRGTYPTSAGGMPITYVTNPDISEICQKVSELGRESIVLFTAITHDEHGHPLISAEVIPKIAAASGAPVYVISDTYIGSGAVGGYVASFAEVGKEGGQMGLRLLAGEYPQDVVAQNEYLFDARQLIRWKIPESALPAGSLVLYRQPNPWESYRYYITAALLLGVVETLLVLGLLWQRATKRRAEESLRDARSRHAAIVESSDDAIVSKNLAGIIMSWNAGAQRVFGYLEAEVIGKPITMLIPQELLDEENLFLERFKAGERVSHYETVQIAKGGQKIAVSLTISALRDSAGKILGFSNIARDISDRKRAEQLLLESEERFRRVANTAPVLIWMSGTDKLCDFFNQGWLSFTGRSIEDELGEGWLSGVHPEDAQRCVKHYSASFDARIDFEMEYRLRRFDGEYRWIVDYGVPRFEPDGTFCGYIGSGVDITERKLSAESLQALSGRLIHAQDEERTRIARELHDDFSQSLALQCIDIEQLRKALPELEIEQRARLVRMLERTKALSADIRSLSHELHSSRLELIGLVPALRGLCKEIGEKFKIAVQFEGDLFVDIPKDVALCLFRVAQEALGNVVKHSGAAGVRVELDSSAGKVRLRITDDGKGFNPEEINPAVGIGLLGMTERLRLVAGRLAVRSELRRGTEVLAEAPLCAGGSKGQARAQAAGRMES